MNAAPVATPGEGLIQTGITCSEINKIFRKWRNAYWKMFIFRRLDTVEKSESVRVMKSMYKQIPGVVDAAIPKVWTVQYMCRTTLLQ